MNKLIKILLTVIMALAMAACGTDKKTASLNDIISSVKKLNDAPKYEVEVNEDEHWQVVIGQIMQEAAWLNLDLEGYVIPTETSIEGLEIEWPFEAYAVDFRYPFFNVQTICKVKLMRDIHEDEISNGLKVGYGASQLNIIGYNGDTPCKHIRNFYELPIKNKGYKFVDNYKKLYLNGAEMMLQVTLAISPESAENYGNMTKIVISDGNDPHASEMMR
jgi:hypothetical protein